MTPRPVAWMVVDFHGRRSVYLDQARAESQAVAQHGVLFDLIPHEALLNPNPDEEAPCDSDTCS